MRILNLVVLGIILNLPFYCFTAQKDEELIKNGGFENDLAGWSSLWTREPNKGELFIDKSSPESGSKCAKIVHKGSLDWSLNTGARIPVATGEWFELSGWFKLVGEGNAMLCLITYDSQGKVLNWSYASKQFTESTNWINIKSRFPIPQGTAFILPRIIGTGSATVWADDISLKRIKSPETVEIGRAHV